MLSDYLAALGLGAGLVGLCTVAAFTGATWLPLTWFVAIYAAHRFEVRRQRRP